MKKSVSCTYHYDPLNRLIGAKLAGQSGSQRFYCQKRIATEVHSTTQHSIMQHGDQLLAQRTQGVNQQNNTLLATDLQRSVLLTMSGAEQQAIAYSPYGHQAPHHDSNLLLGFNGERDEPVTGHYLLGNGYRAFNPVLMRFNSPDSLSPFDEGGINPYCYCDNNPINLSDSSGHIPSLMVQKAVDLFKRSSKGWIDRMSKIYTMQKRVGDGIHAEKMARWAYTPPRRLSLSEPLSTSRTHSNSLQDLDFVGFHGTHKNNIASLSRGLDSERMTGGMNGKGFYTTPHYQVAKMCAGGNDSSVLGVYVKDFQRMKPGRDYDVETGAFFHGEDMSDYTEIIFRKPAYHLVTVNKDIRRKVVFPKSAEAPF